MKKKNLFGTILMIAGFTIIAAAGSMRLWADYKQKSMLDTFQTTLQAADTNQGASTGAEASADTDENVLGVIEIPKIELTAAIGKDVSTETLKYSVGHFEGTALPGEKGNCSIAGHRSYTYSEFFNRLDELTAGDEITIKTSKGSFRYVVYDKFVVEPSHVEVLDATEDATLTLVTCTPIRVATHRLIVKARLQ
ncbi:MAG: sortase family protein, LPXTG-site transpeptidase [Firmicutes bacterium]|nr:sortase family protein, LPXTG-site transpeptidase [Bacillota bacterium]